MCFFFGSIQECACCYCIANLYTVWQTDITFNEVCPKSSKTIYTSGTRMFKRVIYDTEIFNVEFNFLHSPIPKNFGNCAMILRKVTYLGPHCLHFSWLKPKNTLNPYAAGYYLRQRTLTKCQFTSFTQFFGFLRSHTSAP